MSDQRNLDILDEAGDRIAIIGMAGRFPSSPTLNKYWENIRDGVELISSPSDEALEQMGVDPALLANPDYVKAASIVEGTAYFDAQFFQINAREAEVLDPQHRLFLETAWHALEDAGLDPSRYAGLIGVYGGCSKSLYRQENLFSNPAALALVGPYQANLGTGRDHLATRVSYKLNLKGPSLNVQTACSTSLVAVHLACQSLLGFQCDVALAGGVSLGVPQKFGHLYQTGMIYSPDGHCRAFDAKAQGIVGGEGVGIVVLKRLDEALADGDHIHAVIRGSAINNDGAFKVGYTAPSLDGQAEVIAMAQAAADVEPETITYIEAHGTATPLGDSVEIAALRKAFQARTDKKGYCAIGSVKTNIGHADAAAGIAGMIKTVLALQYRQIPPSLHFETPNPELNLADSPFYVNTKLSEWKAGEGPRRAGVSSFGIGGTNAHVIVEEPPTQETSGPSRPRQLLLLSAKTNSALEMATKNLAGHLKNQPDINLADAAYTMQVGRRAFSNRRVVVCQNVDDAIRALDTVDPKRVFTALADMDDRPVVFMFSGQGSQYVNMGLELYRVEPEFRELIDLCAEILKPHLGLDLREVLYPDEKNIDEATRRLTQTSITQPALFAIEYALAKLLAELGIHPRAMIGHSIGEYMAACMAGVFSLEDALEVVAMRGRLIQELPGGAMLAVALAEKETRRLIGSQLSLAADNGASGCVISGTEKNVATLQSELAAKKIHCRRLHTSHAFHSEMMEPILPQFTQFLAKIDLNPPEMRYISNVTGTWITDAEATDPTYWARHLRHTVRFADGIAELLKMPDAILLEVGPGRTLATLARQQVNKTSDRPVLSSLPHPHEQEPDLAFLLNTLGRLWLKGAKVDWTALSGNERRQRISLPTYPFEHQRYWVDPIKPAADEASWPVSPSKNPHIADWFYIPSWIRTQPPEFFKDRALAAQQVKWLVFADLCGLGDKMAKRMEEAGQDVIRVKPGERFERISEGVFTVNPTQGGDYDALLLELKRLNKVPDRIVHLWGVTANEQQQEKSELVKMFQYSGFYSLLFLAQALGATNPADDMLIDVVTNNIHNVTGEEVLYPEKAMVLGPCRVIPQEFPNLKCRNIDITFPAPGNKQEEILINQIMAELTIKPSGQCVAYRRRHRWLQTYEAVKSDKSSEETPRILRNGGIYLITGGLGGIGLVLSEYLARTVRAKLILTGRSAFPAKNEWNQWLETHDANDSVSRKIRKVQALEDLGAEVVVCSADTANLKQMQQVINMTYERFGNLHGVVHAAGILPRKTSQVQTIQKIDQDACKQQFQPKVNGLIVLEKVLQGRRCDFCLLTSSVSSVLGGLGFASYSAGNIFMDAFAQKYHQMNAVPWISVNLDAWQFENKAGRRSGLGAGIAELAIKPEEGKEVFRRILSMASMAQLVISTGNLQNRIEQWVALESSPDTKSSKKKELSSKHLRPDVSVAYVAPRNENEQAVAEIWQELLGIQRIGIYDNYFDLGGDSLLAVQLFARIQKIFGRDLPLNTLFQAQTIEQLAGILRQEDWSSPWSSLVPIQHGGSKPPFFCVHGCTGKVLHFYDLTRLLGPEQPFYGLSALGLEKGQVPHTQFEDMAAHYIKEIRTVQFDGPYFIGGSGDGCPIVIEMAHQLESQGQNIRLMVLFSPTPLKPKIPSTKLYTYRRSLRRFFFLLNNLLKKRPLIPAIVNAFLNRVLWHWRIFHRYLPRHIHRWRRFMAAFSRARFSYTPRAYQGRITCFLSNEFSLNCKKEIDDWYELASGGVDIRFVPGTINTMWQEPHVHMLAEQLKACLEEAQKDNEEFIDTKN